ncbi:MAG: RDD family protein [Bryobacteraceae bacterium]
METAAAPALHSSPAAEARPRFRVKEGGAAARTAPPVQPPLFPSDSRVIGLEQYLPSPPRRRSAPRRPRIAARYDTPLQAAFDFDSVPPGAHEFAAAQQQIPVASLARRAFALLVDLSIVLVGFSLFLVLVRFILGGLPQEPVFLAALSACLWLLASTFFFLHAATGRRTPGQRAAGLQLVTREGRGSEPIHRVFRVLANTIPAVSLIGALWAAITEEHLSFADLITGTYLTVADAS